MSNILIIIWFKFISVDDLLDDDVIVVVVGDVEIVVYCVDGEVFVIDNVCMYGYVCLCDGFFDGYEIECLLYQGKFDVCLGKVMCELLMIDVCMFLIKIEDGYVFVEL